MSQSRRAFLKSTLGVTASVSLTSSIPPLLVQTARAAADGGWGGTDRVLVVVQLSGGNDGLNTVVPVDNDIYGRSRKTLRLNESDILKIDSRLGFHPEMAGFKEMFQQGQLSVVQGVGYPKNHRDHEVAMRDWHTARPGDANCQTGWVGRTVDAVDRSRTADVPAALVAGIPQPFALKARKTIVPAVTKIDRLVLNQSISVPSPEPSGAKGSDQPTADLLDQIIRRGNQQAQVMSQRVQDLLNDADHVAEYPSFTLARQFQVISQLIRANLGIRIFFAEMGGGGIGGFDNHANQRDNHAALLRELSQSVSAFVDDLTRQQLLDRVLLMTFSEFGRTVSENGRRGTGHGAAAPLFLAGGKLEGGFVGEHPSLEDLEQDALKFHTDYRQVYASVLDQWLGLDSLAVLDQQYAQLKLFTG